VLVRRRGPRKGAASWCSTHHNHRRTRPFGPWQHLKMQRPLTRVIKRSFARPFLLLHAVASLLQHALAPKAGSLLPIIDGHPIKGPKRRPLHIGIGTIPHRLNERLGRREVLNRSTATVSPRPRPRSRTVRACPKIRSIILLMYTFFLSCSWTVVNYAEHYTHGRPVMSSAASAAKAGSRVPRPANPTVSTVCLPVCAYLKQSNQNHHKNAPLQKARAHDVRAPSPAVRR
jgi:hypothetical protein